MRGKICHPGCEAGVGPRGLGRWGLGPAAVPEPIILFSPVGGGGGDSRGTMSSGTLITLHHLAREIGGVSVIACIFDYPDHLGHSVLRIALRIMKLELELSRTSQPK